MLVLYVRTEESVGGGEQPESMEAVSSSWEQPAWIALR